MSIPKIFISYRREDSESNTGRIYDHLTENFSPETIFKDVDNMPMGVDFRKHLDQQLTGCRVLLAVIGRQWAENPRLMDEADFVRNEIEHGLDPERDILVVPVLVGNASMPSADQLPPSLKDFAYRNAHKVRPDPDFHRDMDDLINELEVLVDEHRAKTKSSKRINYVMAAIGAVLIIGLGVWLTGQINDLGTGQQQTQVSKLPETKAKEGNPDEPIDPAVDNGQDPRLPNAKGALVWKTVAPMLTKRYTHGVVPLDGKLYLVGGAIWNTSGTVMSRYNSVERYDPVADTWENVASTSLRRGGVSLTALRGKLYAIGGHDGNTPHNSVEIYDPISNSWSAGPAMPSAITQASAVTINDRILLVGGVQRDGIRSKKVFEYSPDTNQWTVKAPLALARELEAVVLDGKVYAIGGQNGSKTFKKVEVYDPGSNTWRELADLTTPRLRASVFVAHGRIYVAGGVTNTRAGGARPTWHNSIEAYDPATNKWTPAGHLPESVSSSRAAIVNGKVYIAGGHVGKLTYTQNVYAADIGGFPPSRPSRNRPTRQQDNQ